MKIWRHGLFHKHPGTPVWSQRSSPLCHSTHTAHCGSSLAVVPGDSDWCLGPSYLSGSAIRAVDVLGSSLSDQLLPIWQHLGLQFYTFWFDPLKFASGLHAIFCNEQQGHGPRGLFFTHAPLEFIYTSYQPPVLLVSSSANIPTVVGCIPTYQQKSHCSRCSLVMIE